MVSAIGRSSLREGAVRPRRYSSGLRRTSVGPLLVVQAAMAFLRKMLITVAMLGAGSGVGLALLAIVTPGEQRKQEMLKEAATTQENVAWRKNWMVSEGGAGERSP
ncbi:ubiquinol-cytochrome-c reductase complex assembly factor 3 isoform X2 [Piliocolobus tephrosceles]|uniref:ubiquinol-cytochrome-c reductase complex assembly factor 3 isoform X2 n=1 Tax=Piliocolobus tephrosceles TaxID=591936 RepID=UPI000C299FAA|nr:ubiquinol-cytochrome-c reductase complex assembly factor 3 isoform X2 [Piliocolobus tephrosceles]